jgi:hypothetical protein
MTTPTQTTVFLGEFETKSVIDLGLLAPGTYYYKLMVRCNSLLSSVFLQACPGGATVKANYFDTTTGDELTPERYELTGHDLLGPADAGSTNRILVTKIHNKPQLEIIVTGSAVNVGVYVTAVSTTASDLDAALIRDGDTWLPTVSKAIPVACLDEDTGELNFLRCPLKVVIVGDTVPGNTGDVYYLRGSVACVPGSTQIVLTDTVPALTVRYLKSLWVTAFNDGEFSLKAAGVEIAAGLISNVQHNISFRFDPPRPISPGTLLELEFSSDSEPNYPCQITAFLSGNDST